MEKKKTNKGKVIFLVILTVLAVAASAAFGVMYFNGLLPGTPGAFSVDFITKTLLPIAEFQYTPLDGVPAFLYYVFPIISYVIAVLGLVSFIICCVKKRGFLFSPLIAFILSADVFFVGAIYLTVTDATLVMVSLIFFIALAVLTFLMAFLPLVLPYVKKAKDEVTPLPLEEGEEEKPVEGEQIPEEANGNDSNSFSNEPVEETKSEEKEEEPALKEEPKEEAPVEEKKEAPVEEEAPAEEPKEEVHVEESKPLVKPSAKKSAAAPAKKETSKVQGKYEVYPEAGFFKYRLKANNGEILIVSNPYKTRNSAHAGIDTLEKSMGNGIAKIVTDKKGCGQFRIFTGNDARLIVAGEFYPNAAGAERALASAQKFYLSEKVVDLDEIPEEEIREWQLVLPKGNPSDKGKLELFLDDDKKYRGKLLANNGQLLFMTASYASKSGVLSAIDKIKEKFAAGKDITVTKDKQGRFQFVCYANNGMVLVMGESYTSRDRAESSAASVRNFIAKPTLVDNTKPA